MRTLLEWGRSINELNAFAPEQDDTVTDTHHLESVLASRLSFSLGAQPYLRRLLGSPSINERWKPSTTHMQMVPDPVGLNKMGVAGHRLLKLVCTDNFHQERCQPIAC